MGGKDVEKERTRGTKRSGMQKGGGNYLREAPEKERRLAEDLVEGGTNEGGQTLKRPNQKKTVTHETRRGWKRFVTVLGGVQPGREWRSQQDDPKKIDKASLGDGRRGSKSQDTKCGKNELSNVSVTTGS